MYKFSVIVATHQRPLLLRRALQSIRAQSHQNIQLIIVSDVKCADTEHVVEAMLGGDDLFVQRHGRPGPAASRNLGIKLIDGDFAVFLDDDDTFTETFFDNISPHLRTDDVIYTDHHVVFGKEDASGYAITNVERRALGDRRLEEIYIKNFIPLHCLVYPKHVLQGRTFDTDLILNEDWDFVLNIMSDTSLRYAPLEGPVIYKRDTSANRGRTNLQHLPDIYRRIYKRWPAPTQDIKSARKAILEANGIVAAIEDL